MVMKAEDVGFILVILTMVNPVAYLVYQIATGFSPFSYEILKNVGRNGLLFLIDTALFYCGLLLMLRGLRGDKEKLSYLMTLLYLIPMLNVLVAVGYSCALMGFPEGLALLSEAPLITFYNIMIFLTLLLIDLPTRGPIREFLSKERGPLVLIGILLAFTLVKVTLGTPLYVLVIFLILTIVASYIFLK